MGAPKELVVLIDTEGVVTMLYTEDIDINAFGGTPEIKRASHVEPTNDGKWTADMSPVGGPMLGPYDLRSEALDAEVRWLNANTLSGNEVPQAALQH